MVKSRALLKNIGTLWRDGRAAEGACLENMFGSHQRGFKSHSLRQTNMMIDGFRFMIDDEKINNLKTRQIVKIGEVPEWSNGAAC